VNLLSVRREVGEFKKRYKWMALVVMLSFLVLMGRMIQLQLVEYEHYSQIARENITRTVTLPATRGIVRDSQGRVVATNRAAYNLYVTPQYLAEGDLARIAELMGWTAEQRTGLEETVANVPARRRAHQRRVADDISRDQLAAIETHEQDFCLRTTSRNREPQRLPCISVIAEPMRTYPFGPLSAHALGYLTVLDDPAGRRPRPTRAQVEIELERRREQGYRLGDRIGRTGVERAWESFLRGRRGYRRVYVDVRGRQLEGERAGDPMPVRREPVPGRDLTLTVDMELMRIIDRAFGGHPAGAVVVVDVRTGAIRALYSKPSFDLSTMAAGLSQDEYVALRDDPFRPLNDKTIYEAYFPGSTLKPITALAALEQGVVDPTEHFECQGSYLFGRTAYGCTAQHGEVDFREALVQSCNVYFYRIAERVGLDPLARLAGEFGLGRRTGVGINAEAAGFIPTRGWYVRNEGRWRPGHTLNAAIGQGDVKVTLIQLAMSYAAIANGGTLYVPQLVERVNGPDGSLVESFQPRVRRRVHVDPAHLALVIDGMYGAVNDRAGTAFDAHIEGGVPVAGKTGTAQIARRWRPGDDPERSGYNNRAHAWFAGFAPAEAPEVAIVVLVEHGGAGGRQAAPIAINILQEYLGEATTTTAHLETPRGAHLAHTN
jgi:penicillin-binding protein 2